MRLRIAAGVFLAFCAAAAQSIPSVLRPPDVPYVPTTEEVVDGMLDLGRVAKSDIVYDLGCGDGRIVITAAKRFGAQGVGVDINPRRIAEAKANAKEAGVESLVRFEENDLFEADIHKATVVMLYLLPEVNMRLLPKLLKDLKPGTRVVSHSFDMGDWKPEKREEVGGATIYLWTIPEKK